VVKNTLTRRAAEAAGADALLTLLEGPSAIAFIESDGDMVAVAKALADSAKDTKILEIRGGVMQGKAIAAGDVDELAKLPPFDVLRGQVLGAIVAPLQNLLGSRQCSAPEPRRADRRPSSWGISLGLIPQRRQPSRRR
jgi:large subunit ribosomal protein L10